MSDKLLPIDRVAELENVGIFIYKKEHQSLFGNPYDSIVFLLFELSQNKNVDEYLIFPLAMQRINIEKWNVPPKFMYGERFAETKLLGTPYDGGYGAAIHDFVLWWINTNYGPRTVSIADRGSVRPDAARVREIYANTRKGSVSAFPIDNENERLTPKLDDDYQTHFEHGGFDVYPEYKRQPMANDPQAYKDWAVRLTPKGKKEINAACKHLEKNGEKMVEYLCTKNFLSSSILQEKMVTLADKMFWSVYLQTDELGKSRLEITPTQIDQTIGDFFIAPILDKTKKSKQKLGKVLYKKSRKQTKEIPKKIYKQPPNNIGFYDNYLIINMLTTYIAEIQNGKLIKAFNLEQHVGYDQAKEFMIWLTANHAQNFNLPEILKQGIAIRRIPYPFTFLELCTSIEKTDIIIPNKNLRSLFMEYLKDAKKVNELFKRLTFSERISGPSRDMTYHFRKGIVIPTQNNERIKRRKR